MTSIYPSQAYAKGMASPMRFIVLRGRDVFLHGAVTGALVGLFLATVTRVANPMCYLWSALMTFSLILVGSVFLMRYAVSKMRWCRPQLEFFWPPFLLKSFRYSVQCLIPTTP